MGGLAPGLEEFTYLPTVHTYQQYNPIGRDLKLLKRTLKDPRRSLRSGARNSLQV